MKKRMGLSVALLSFIFVVATLMMSCTATMDVTVPVNLTNTSNSTYTIWIGHATEVLASNDIVAGGSRSTSVTMKAQGPSEDKPRDLSDSIKVNVAQNGKLITTEKLSVKMPYDGNMVLTLQWDGKSFSIK